MSDATEIFNFDATIKALSSDAMSAVVQLDEPIAGFKFAVVNDETKGRLSVMSSELFKEGTKVRCCALRGIDAFRVTEMVLIKA